jgi:hypothetical protein
MTLSQRMEMGRVPVSEAVRLSMSLAEILRRLHDDGKVWGALTPDCLEVKDSGLELLPPSAHAGVTPYTAPEVAQGKAPDARADIFAFGTIVFELMTGRKAAENGDVASENPALDRVVRMCRASEPEARVARIQTVMIELKLLAVAARRAEVLDALRHEKSETLTRSEFQELERRMEARFETLAEIRERAVAELQRAANDAEEILREQISALRAELTAAQERLVAADARFYSIGERTESIVRSVEEVSRRSQQVEQTVLTELRDLARTQKAQASAIEASRAAAAQNEDLMERVIESLESLQSVVLEKPSVEELAKPAVEPVLATVN